MTTRRAHSGFTLVELLVSVAIVGILASISVGNFSEYRNHARNLHALATVHNMILGFNSALIDFGTVQQMRTKLGFTVLHSYNNNRTNNLWAPNPTAANAILRDVKLNNPDVSATLFINNYNDYVFMAVHCKTKLSSSGTLSGYLHQSHYITRPTYSTHLIHKEPYCSKP